MRAAGREVLRVRRPRRRAGRPRGPSQAGRLREALVAAACRQYAGGGRSGISFSALAADVGLRKATVFHYFPTKDAVVAAVFAALGAALAERQQGWFAAPPAGYGPRLERVVGELVDFYERDAVHARIVCRGLLEVEGPALAGGASALDDFVRGFADFLRAGMAAGELHAADPVGVMMALGGLILFEVMIPETARRAYGRRTRGATRREEILALVRRGLVRGAS